MMAVASGIRRVKALVGRIGFVSMVAALSAAGYYWGSAYFVDRQAGGLVVDPRALDLGEVWASDQYIVRLPVRNTSSVPIAVSELSASCNCTAIEPRSFTVPPGGETVVQLTMNLYGYGAAGAGLAAATWPFEVTVMPRPARGMAKQRGWTLRATVRSVLSLSKSVIDFGDLATGVTASHVVHVRPHRPLTGLKALSTSDQLEILLTPPRGVSEEYTLLVQASTNGMSMGPFDVPVYLVPTVEAGSERVPPVRLVVRGNNAGPVLLDPKVARLGGIRVGDEVEQAVLLRSPAGIPFTIERIKVDNSAVSIFPLSRTAPDVAQLSLRCAPSRPGQGAATVLISTLLHNADKADGATVDLALPVRFAAYERPAEGVEQERAFTFLPGTGENLR